MNNLNNIESLITNYVQGNLEGDALLSFEKRMASDSELAQQVALEQAMYEALLDMDTLNLKKMMQSDFSTSTGSNTTRNVVLSGLGVLFLGALSYAVFTKKDLSEEVSERKELPQIVENSKPIQEELVAKEELSATQKIEGVVEDKVKNKSIEVPKEIRVEAIVAARTEDPIIVQEDKKPIILSPKEVNKPSKSNEELPVVVKDPCQDFKVNGKFKTTNAFANTSTGTIVLDRNKVSGGTLPFSYSIDNKKFEYLDEFKALKTGNYTVFVKDSKNCVVKSEAIYVNYTNCIEDYTPTYDASTENEWKIPVVKDAKVQVSLIDVQGQVLVQRVINSDEDSVWRGFTDKGQKPSVGAYKWVIVYESGEKCLAKMTILN
jgi:hypothetical protein